MHSSQGHTLRIRLFAVAEVVVAASVGILSPILLIFLGVSLDEALGSAPVLGLLFFADATCTLGFLWIMQRIRGRTLASLGWKRRGQLREIRVGLQAFPGLLLLMLLLSGFFQAVLPGWVSEENLVLGLIDTPVDLVIFLFAALYVGGIKEELQRAFILSRFEDHLGGALPGLFLWSIAFGWMHQVQGADNAVKAGLLGLVLGLLYLKRRRLEAPIVAHALFDVAVILLVYFFPQLAGSG